MTCSSGVAEVSPAEESAELSPAGAEDWEEELLSPQPAKQLSARAKISTSARILDFIVSVSPYRVGVMRTRKFNNTIKMR